MLVFGPTFLLAAATLFAAFDLVRDDRRLRLASLGLASGAALARTWSFVEHGVCPLGTSGGALGALALFLTLHVVVGFRIAVSEPLRNVALLGVATLIDAGGRFADFTRGVVGTPAAEPMRELHAGTVMLAYAALTIGGLYAAAYLVLDRLVRGRRIGFWFERLPPLGRLEVRAARSEAIGFVLLTVGLALGVHLLAAEGRSAVDPKILWSLGLWGVTGAFVLLRRGGHRGTRIMWLPVLGLVLMVAAYVAPGSEHPFGGEA